MILIRSFYEAKFGRRDFFYKVMLAWERWTFKVANSSIATNESYKKIAIERGGMDPDKVHVVRSGPKTGSPADHRSGRILPQWSQVPGELCRCHG